MKSLGMLLSVSVVCWLAAGARGDDSAKLPVDNDFLVKAATCNHAVIAISKMAETHGSPEVKAFAGQLGKDHQAAYEKLAELLKTRKIGVVSGTEKGPTDEAKRLGALKGTDFNQEYLKWVIKEHKSGIALCENQIKQGKDEDVSAFAKDGLVGLRKHLKMAEELAKTSDSR